MRDYQKRTTRTLILASQNSRNFWLLIMCILVAGSLTVTGCKSKKVVTETPPPENTISAEQERINRAKAALEDLLNSPQSKTFAELEGKERRLADIQDMNIDDGEVQVLIKKVEYKLEQERAFLEAEEARKKEREMYNRLAGEFEQIANAPNVNVANTRIKETLNHFASEDVLVLVVISEENGRKDFDRPTTIGKYLNYLKDQRQSKNSIGKIVYDSSGKIKELELVKDF